MKNYFYILFASLLWSHAHASEQTRQPFTGFSLIAGIVGTNVQLDVTQDILADIPSFINPALPGEVAVYQNGIGGALGVDYLYEFSPGIVLGAAFVATYAPVEAQNKAVFDVIGPSTLITLNSDLKTTLQNDFALLFKPGFVWGKNTLFYGLIGPRWGNFKTTLDSDFVFGDPTNPPFATSQGSDEVSTYELGFTAGLGIQQRVTSRFNLGLEYAYTTYGTIDAPEVNADIIFLGSSFGTLSDLPSLKAQTNTLMLTFSYRC